MKRSPLKRSGRTSAASTARSKPNPRRPDESPPRPIQPGKRAESEPGKADWKRERTGRCSVCGRRGRLLRHHVLLEQMVRVAGADPWDLDNAMDVGAYCRCHERHHAGGEGRIWIGHVPAAAVAFTRRVLGEGPAENYFNRRYNTQPRGVA